MGEGRFFLHDPKKLRPRDPECATSGQGGGRRHAQPWLRGHSLLAEKIAGPDQSNGGFLAGRGSHRDFDATLLQIENAVGWISLREEDLRPF